MVHEESTRRPRRPRGSAGPREVPALTLLCHPEVRRIGDRVLLHSLRAGEDAPLSRNAPELGPPRDRWQGESLGDPYLSRKPWLIRALGEDVLELRQEESPIPVAVDGVPLAGNRVFHRPELQVGVVLELAERIALLLHLVQEPGSDGTRDDHGLVGESTALDQVRSALERVAGVEVPVLLRGESGTGKELVARALHRSSPRRNDPFVAVNLGAIPPALAASELFGNVKGAFTGAVTAGEGYFRAAHGGTLFLDEVGEAPPEVQVMLLRALETGEVFPVGSPRPRKVDVRLVAATDADLEARAEDGRFRAPLLHRLSAYEIRLPPLRQRREDIGRLFLHFARQERRTLGEPELPPEAEPPWLPASLLARLSRYRWPGNVRQLKNVVRQLVIDGRGKPVLEAGPRVEKLLTEESRGRKASTAEEEIRPPRRRPSDVSETELEEALAENAFELAESARKLRISRASLYNLIRRHPRLKTAEDVPEGDVRHALDAAGGDVASAARALGVSARALARRVRRRDPGT